jgi:hypothetical protein
MQISGFESCFRLRETLASRFGSAIVPDPLATGSDAFGWRLLAIPRLLFSVSTLGGELPTDRFDLQISVCDQSAENGEVLLGPESPALDIEQICSLVAQYLGDLAVLPPG